MCLNFKWFVCLNLNENKYIYKCLAFREKNKISVLWTCTNFVPSLTSNGYRLQKMQKSNELFFKLKTTSHNQINFMWYIHSNKKKQVEICPLDPMILSMIHRSKWVETERGWTEWFIKMMQFTLIMLDWIDNTIRKNNL